MIKRLTIALGIVFVACSVLQAQVQNYALRLDTDSSVDCGPMPQLSGAATYTLQFWINPDQWTQGAVLLERGTGLKASLGTPGELSFTLGNATLTAKSDLLKAGQWAQVTILCSDSKATVLVDGVPAGSAEGTSLSESNSSFIIGGNGYKGRIDEFRIWKCLLSDQFDYYMFNTLNEWMPQYEDLLVYYKMDQELCENLVDYCAIDKDSDFNNHGVLIGGATKEAVTDNDKMPYLINSAYTANERFYDRVIPAEQYRLSNDIIILGVQSFADGHLELSSANDHATLEGSASQLDNYEGRMGVLSLDGNGWIEAPATALNNSTGYGFESFIYLDEWTDGACLIRRESEDGTQGFSVSLDHFTSDRVPEPTAVLVLRVNGNCWRYPVDITTGEWHHLGIGYRGGTSVSDIFNLALDGEQIKAPRTFYHDGGTDGKPVWPEGVNVVIGKNLKAKLDQTVIPRAGANVGEFAQHMRNGMPMVSLTQQVTSTILQNAGAYYEFDDAENPGFDLYSQDNWLRIMKSAFDGYRGYKFYLSVKTPAGYNDSNLNMLISQQSWRENFARDLALFSEPYDGVELDLEWVYNWNFYGRLAEAIREALPEGKLFRVSTHNVTYGFPLDKMDLVDGFTFQQYGPQKEHFIYSKFEQYCRGFVDYGYPRDKIMTSYSTTTSEGDGGTDIRGVKDGFFGPDYEPVLEAESGQYGSDTFWFTGPLQTYARAKYTREQLFKGIFYWDMGNDVWDQNSDGSHSMSKWNLARWSTYAINSNVDRLVTEVSVNHANSGIDAVEALTATSLSVACDGTCLRLCFPGKVLESVALYTVGGSLAFQSSLTDGSADVSAVVPGIYILRATSADAAIHTTKFIKK